MNSRVPKRRALPLPAAAVAVIAAAVALLSTGSAVAQSECESVAHPAATKSAAIRPAATSQPCESFGEGSDSLLSIHDGDQSQITVTSSDPSTDIEIRVNLDAPITCFLHGRPYTGPETDQYDIVINGGSTVNEPTLTIKHGEAYPGGLAGAQFAIATGQAQICFAAPKPFTVLAGSALTTTNDPGFGLQYVGLLPDCSSLRRGVVGPCISSRSASQIPTPTGSTGVVTFGITVPPGFDPRLAF